MGQEQYCTSVDAQAGVPIVECTLALCQIVRVFGAPEDLAQPLTIVKSANKRQTDAGLIADLRQDPAAHLYVELVAIPGQELRLGGELLATCDSLLDPSLADDEGRIDLLLARFSTRGTGGRDAPLSYARVDVRPRGGAPEEVRSWLTDRHGVARAATGPKGVEAPLALPARARLELAVTPFEPQDLDRHRKNSLVVADALRTLREAKASPTPRDARILAAARATLRKLTSARFESAPPAGWRALASASFALDARPRFVVALPAVNETIVVAGERVDIGWPVALAPALRAPESAPTGRYAALGTRTRLPVSGTVVDPQPIDVALEGRVRAEWSGPRDERWTLDGAPDLEALRTRVGLVVLHVDQCPSAGAAVKYFSSLECSATAATRVTATGTHFCIDNDGTIYQVLDPWRGAYHAGPVNSRSVGIDLSSLFSASKLGYYEKTWDGATDCQGGVLEPRRAVTSRLQFVGATDGTRPVTSAYIEHYDVQYRALAHLLAGLSHALDIPLTYPAEDSRDPADDTRTVLDAIFEARRALPGGAGLEREPRQVVQDAARVANAAEVEALNLAGITPRRDVPQAGTAPLYVRLTPPDAADGDGAWATPGPWRTFRGVVNHHHVNANRQDAGPLLDWPRLMREAEVARRAIRA